MPENGNLRGATGGRRGVKINQKHRSVRVKIHFFKIFLSLSV
jgi:hypothetical protein